MVPAVGSLRRGLPTSFAIVSSGGGEGRSVRPPALWWAAGMGDPVDDRSLYAPPRRLADRQAAAWRAAPDPATGRRLGQRWAAGAVPASVPGPSGASTGPETIRRSLATDSVRPASVASPIDDPLPGRADLTAMSPLSAGRVDGAVDPPARRPPTGRTATRDTRVGSPGPARGSTPRVPAVHGLGIDLAG